MVLLTPNRVFSHDVTAAIFVSQNNETAAMLVSQTSPVGVELFSYVNAFFCSNKFAYKLATCVKTLYREEKSLRHVAMVAKFLDDNKPIKSLKSLFALFQSSPILFTFIKFGKSWRNFLWDRIYRYLSLGKKATIFVLCSPSP